MDTTKSKMKKKILSDSNYDKIWSIDDFKEFPRMDVIKAFSDLVKDGVLKRAKRGFYFRSKKTVLGETSYTDIQLALSKAKSKCDFYCISGLAGYNELGLTTQVPNNIVIACDYNLRSEDKIKYIYRKNPVNGGKTERIVLDAIIDIKTIPDTTIEKTINQIKILIKYEDFITILLSQIWGKEPRNVACKNYVFDYINIIEKIIQDGIDKGELNNVDPQVLASSIFGFTCSSLLYKIKTEKELDIQTLYKEYVNVLLGNYFK